MDGVRILVIDNDRAHLIQLESYLKDSRLTLVVADTLDRGLQELSRSFFDIVLVELHWKALTGLDLVDRIRAAHPGTGVMLMSAEVHVDLVIEALRRRAVDFIIKPVAPEVLIQRVEAAVLVQSTGVDLFLHYCLQTMRHLFSERGITPRERQVIMLLLKGLRYQEVAGRLFISYQTVKTHVNRIYRKLGITSRSQIMEFIFRRMDD